MTYRGYRIEQLGTFPMVKIMAPGSGPTPADLDGTFTTAKMAEKQIDLSLAKMMGKKRKTNGKTESAPSR